METGANDTPNGAVKTARSGGEPKRRLSFDFSQDALIRLEAIKVEGRIQKPQAFYILQRSNLNFESLELKQSFVPKIVESVERDPF